MTSFLLRRKILCIYYLMFLITCCLYLQSSYYSIRVSSRNH